MASRLCRDHARLEFKSFLFFSLSYFCCGAHAAITSRPRPGGRPTPGSCGGPLLFGAFTLGGREWQCLECALEKHADLVSSPGPVVEVEPEGGVAVLQVVRQAVIQTLGVFVTMVGGLVVPPGLDVPRRVAFGYLR